MYKEIEVRFLEIDKQKLLDKLISLGAQDRGEEMLEERIIYDKSLSWRDNSGKILRLRKTAGVTKLAYKERLTAAADGVEEIEFEVSDIDAAEALLDRIGYAAYRHQQKIRHTFVLDGVTVDIDTWPRIPTYVELEGGSEEELKRIAVMLELDWSTVEMRSPTTIIEEVYAVPVQQIKWFTFDRFE